MRQYESASVIAFFILAISASPAFCENYTIYSPGKDISGENPPVVGENEILVKDVRIRRGDTLSRISRRYSGRGSYFPQILLFNGIRNPDVIYAGDTLKVPVASGNGAPKTSHRPVKRDSAGKVAAQARVKAPGIGASENQAGKNGNIKQDNVNAVKSAKIENSAERKLFEEGMRYYKLGECVKAIEFFDRFLAEYQSSPLASEAALNKGECLLRLSASP